MPNRDPCCPRCGFVDWSYLPAGADMWRWIKQYPRGVTVADVAEHFGMRKTAAQQMLTRLWRIGALVRENKRRVYEADGTRNKFAFLYQTAPDSNGPDDRVLTMRTVSASDRKRLAVQDG